MPQKKRFPRPFAKRRASAKSYDSGSSRRLNDVAEQVEMIVPEVTARVAALEHLLLEKQLCTREELVRAREFIRVQED
jgi:Holliday junction resolvasome RuvABC endonuclease subunit